MWYFINCDKYSANFNLRICYRGACYSNLFSCYINGYRDNNRGNGRKKVIVNENYIVFLEKKIPLNNISHIMISYPFIEIKTNQLKSNRWLIDYNLDLIENLEKYIESVKIEYKNLIETAELFQNVFKNKSFEKEDIHSIFREKDKFIIILKIRKFLKLKFHIL